MVAHVDHLPVLWRTKLRSTRPDPPVVHSEQVRHCVENGLIGIGWGLDELPSRSSLDVVLSTIETKNGDGWGKRAAQIVRRFASDAEIGDFVWTLHGRPLPDLHVDASEVLQSYLDPYDVEDLVYVWLQLARGFVALPRARQRDMPAYEYTLIHRETGRRAIAQIKTGATPVDLAALAAAAVDEATQTFAFATSGRYIGDSSLVTEVIAEDELLRFVRDYDRVLPPRVRTLFQLVAQGA